MEDLPEFFDVVVMGTGLPECILAAACARNGLSVLHLDTNDYYGDLWASFSFEQLGKWIDKYIALPPAEQPFVPAASVIQPGEVLHSLQSNFPWITDVRYEWHGLDNCDEEATSEKMNKKTLNDQSRQFNIDLVPMVMLGNGSMVKWLMSSDVSRYLEFKHVNRILIQTNGQLCKVPFSRSDIFQSKELDVMQKRSLMKFLTKLMREGQEGENKWTDFADREAVEFLKYCQLDDQSIHYLINLFPKQATKKTTSMFLSDLRLLFSSVGAWSCPTPFLWPLYGCGDLAQAFSRSCAVYGGIYCLNCKVDGWITDESRDSVNVVIVNGRRIRLNYLISSVNYVPSSMQNEFFIQSDEQLRRAIFVYDRSKLSESKETVSLANLNFDDELKYTAALELGSSTLVVPPGFHLLHLMSSQNCNADKAIWEMAAKRFFQEHVKEGEQNVHFTLFYSQRELKIVKPKCKRICKNVIVSAPPSIQIVLDTVIDEAESLFHHFWPDLPFFQKVDMPESEHLDG